MPFKKNSRAAEALRIWVCKYLLNTSAEISKTKIDIFMYIPSPMFGVQPALPRTAKAEQTNYSAHSDENSAAEN